MGKQPTQSAGANPPAQPPQSAAEGVLMALAYAAILLALLTLTVHAAGVIESQMLIRVLAVVSIVGIFPVSYAAYRRLRTEAHIQRLKTEFDLLGLQEEDLGGGAGMVQVDETVSDEGMRNAVRASWREMYETVYNPWQYLLYITLILITSLTVLFAFVAQGGQSNLYLPPAGSPAVVSRAGDLGAGAEITATGAATQTQGSLPAAPVQAATQPDLAADVQTPAHTVIELMFIGYLGAYVYSVLELVRRYNTFDLQPQVYASILVRMLVAIVLIYVASSAIVAFGPAAAGNTPEPTAGYASIWGPAVIAFAIGAFPNRGIAWLTGLADNVLGPRGDTASELPIQNLLGISTWHASRLHQMGIDDAQNLAGVDIRRLLLTTPFDPRVILSWIDQAILYVKVGQKISQFRAAQIVTFYDLQTALQRLEVETGIDLDNSKRDERDQRFGRFAAKLGLADADALLPLRDYTNFPNYEHIAAYYARIGYEVQRLADRGGDRLATLQAQGAYTDVIRFGERMVQVAGKKVAPFVYNALGEAYYRSGLQEARSGRSDQATQLYRNARKNFTEAIRANPRYAEAYLARGLCQIELREYDQAIRSINEAMALRPGYAEAYNNRALAYIYLREVERARKDLDEALRLDGRLAMAHYNLARLHLQRREFDDAIRKFHEAYLAGYDAGQVSLGTGRALVGKKEYAAAVEAFSDALELRPNLIEAYLARAGAYREQGPTFLPNAVLDLKSALKLDDRNLEARYTLAEALILGGDKPQALSHFQAIVDRGPEIIQDEADLAARYLLAASLDRLDKKEEARAHYDWIVKADPARKFEETAKAKVWLARYQPPPPAGS